MVFSNNITMNLARIRMAAVVAFLVISAGCATTTGDIVSWQNLGKVEKITAVLNDTNEKLTVRIQAAVALGRLADPSTVSALTNIAENTRQDVDLRVECVQALGKIQGDQAHTALIRLTSDRTYKDVLALWEFEVKDAMLRDVPFYLTNYYRGAYLLEDPNRRIMESWSFKELFEGDVMGMGMNVITLITPLKLERYQLSGRVKLFPMGEYDIFLSESNSIFHCTKGEAEILQSWGATVKRFEAAKRLFPIKNAALKALENLRR